MKITRVKIENWRNIHRIELSFAPRLTIVHGPNETGKSTVQEAIRHAILVDAASAARELGELVPWGSTAKAHVELSLLTAAGDGLRIEKSFPKGEGRLYLEGSAGRERPEAMGTRQAAAGSQGPRLLAEGRTLQQRIFASLGVPAEAADLFGLLWIGQGESLALFAGKPESGPVEGPAQTLVKSLIKENLLSSRAEELYRELKEEWEAVYQKSGKPRKGSRLGELERREADLKAEIAAAGGELDRIESTAAELARTEEEIAALETARGEAALRLSLLERKQEEGAKLEPRAGEVVRLEEEQRRLIGFEAAEREVVALLPGAWAGKREALASWVAQLEERRSHAVELEKLLERSRAEAAGAKVTERRTLDELEEHARLAREARLRLEASGVSVRVRRSGGGPVTLRVSRDEAAAEELALEDEERWEASRSVRLSVDSRLEVDCSGPLLREEWERLTGEIARAEQALARRLAALGCTSLAEAKAAFDRHLEEEAERSRLEGELKALLGPGGTGLATELEEAERAKEGLEQEGRLLEELGIGAPGRELPPRQPGVASPVAGARSPREGEGAGRPQRGFAELVRALAGELAAGLRRIEEGRLRRSELLGGRTREEFTRELYALKEEVAHAKRVVAAMEPAELEAVSPVEVKAQRSAVERLSGQLFAAAERRSALRARLEGAGGLVERKERAERELATVERELAAVRRRIDAVSLLIRLIEEEKEEIDRNILAPLEERLTRAFRELVGERYSAVRITDQLGIGGIAALEGQINIGPGALSYGTREQLSFLFRLLLAQYLSAREPQVMMLDDTFVNTDAQRRELLLRMMMSEEKGVQFILFTCHGEHYEPLREHEGVTVIDLTRPVG